jgi:hypothetical protein
MEFQLSKKVLNFLGNKNIRNLLLVVDFSEEPCTQIYNPIAKPFENAENEEMELLGTEGNLSFYISPEFIERFGKPDRISLALKGLMKKRIEISNIDPQITNICKI